MSEFKLVSVFPLTGDQPQAVDRLVEGYGQREDLHDGQHDREGAKANAGHLP